LVDNRIRADEPSDIMRGKDMVELIAAASRPEMGRTFALPEPVEGELKRPRPLGSSSVKELTPTLSVYLVPAEGLVEVSRRKHRM
jgi:hypothetical protein